MVTAIKTKAIRGRSKYQFTCKEPSCYRHMWLCTKHSTTNQGSMNTRAATLEKDHGLKLVYILDCSMQLASKEDASSPTPSLQPSHLQSSTGAQPTSPCPRADIKTFRAAEKKMRKNVRKHEGPVEIVPVPEGEPMFMFQALKGRTDPVYAFYDGGCSNACLKTGVPGDQLKGQVLAKGPFTIEGVNGVLIKAQDEWLVLRLPKRQKKFRDPNLGKKMTSMFLQIIHK